MCCTHSGSLSLPVLVYCTFFPTVPRTEARKALNRMMIPSLPFFYALELKKTRMTPKYWGLTPSIQSEAYTRGRQRNSLSCEGRSLSTRIFTASVSVLPLRPSLPPPPPEPEILNSDPSWVGRPNVRMDGPQHVPACPDQAIAQR